MIKTIRNNGKLNKYIKDTIEDAGIEVKVAPELCTEQYVGIKVDDYYNDQHLDGETPKSVDYIVPVDCECNSYVLYILEFKNVNEPRNIINSEIRDKFDTAINRFLKNDFSDIFEKDQFKYRDMKLYLVTTAYKKAMEYGSYEAYLNILKKVKGRDTLELDIGLASRPYRFRNMVRYIQKEVPPNPLIKRIT